MKRYLIAAAAALLSITAVSASEVRELTLPPADVIALSSALGSIGAKERICKDGANEKPCTEYVKVPNGLSMIIALDLRALKGIVEDYQYAQRKIITAVSGGTGVLEPRSKQEAEASAQIIELGRTPIRLTLSTFSAKELDDAKIDITPSVRSALLPILDDAR